MRRETNRKDPCLTHNFPTDVIHWFVGSHTRKQFAENSSCHKKFKFLNDRETDWWKWAGKRKTNQQRLCTCYLLVMSMTKELDDDLGMLPQQRVTQKPWTWRKNKSRFVFTKLFWQIPDANQHYSYNNASNKNYTPANPWSKRTITKKSVCNE